VLCCAVLCCAVQETDEERGRRIASQWTNDPAAAGSAVRAQDATRPQQQHAPQPQHAQPTTHTAVTSAHVKTASSTNTSRDAASRGASNRGIGRGRSELSHGGSSTADRAGQELAGGRHTAAAAAGVVVAQRAYVMVWAVLLVGCVAIGGRRLLARTQR
jgi:cobalamin biosynthesis Mg chelatase CobN